jgi:hypothetical protein
MRSPRSALLLDEHAPLIDHPPPGAVGLATSDLSGHLAAVAASRLLMA